MAGGDPELMRTIGQLEGKVDHMCAVGMEQTEELRHMRKQLMDLERAQAKSGAISGGIVAVGVSLIGAAIHKWVGGGP